MLDSFDLKKDTADPFWAFLKGVHVQPVDVEIGEHCGASVLSSKSGKWVQVSPERLQAALAHAVAAGRAYERSRGKEGRLNQQGWLSRQVIRFRAPLVIGSVLVGVLLSTAAFRPDHLRGGTDIDPGLLALGIAMLVGAALIYGNRHS